MHQYIVFRTGFGQYIVNATSPVRAIQSVIAIADGFASDWVVHALSGYNPKMQSRLILESVNLGDAV